MSCFYCLIAYGQIHQTYSMTYHWVSKSLPGKNHINSVRTKAVWFLISILAVKKGNLCLTIKYIFEVVNRFDS